LAVLASGLAVGLRAWVADAGALLQFGDNTAILLLFSPALT
jgi:hypothetical protein